MQINIIYVSEPFDFTLSGMMKNLQFGVFAIRGDDVKYVTGELGTPYEDAVAHGEAYFAKKEAKANG